MHQKMPVVRALVEAVTKFVVAELVKNKHKSNNVLKKFVARTVSIAIQ